MWRAVAMLHEVTKVTTEKTLAALIIPLTVLQVSQTLLLAGEGDHDEGDAEEEEEEGLHDGQACIN